MVRVALHDMRSRKYRRKDEGIIGLVGHHKNGHLVQTPAKRTGSLESQQVLLVGCVLQKKLTNREGESSTVPCPSEQTNTLHVSSWLQLWIAAQDLLENLPKTLWPKAVRNGPSSMRPNYIVGPLIR